MKHFRAKTKDARIVWEIHLHYTVHTVLTASNVESNPIAGCRQQADFIESFPAQGGAKLNQLFDKFSPRQVDSSSQASGKARE